MMVEPIGQCLSDFRIDQWLGGELAADAATALQAHAARCATCAGRVETLTASRDRFAQAAMPPALAAALADHAQAQPAATRPQLSVVQGGRDAGAPVQDPRPAAPAPASTAPASAAPARSRRLLVVAAPALAAAAAVLLLLRAPGPDAPGTPGDTGTELTGATGDTGTQAIAPAERTKGNARITVFVVRDGAAHAAAPSAPSAPAAIVHPGDTLQITYTAAEPGYLAVLSRDGAGVGSIYFDDHGRAAAMAPGQDVPLPHSIVLDDTLGREALYALFCTTAVALEPARQSLEAATFTPPAGCRSEELVIEKRAP